MTEIQFHIYDKGSDNKVVAHSLTVDQLEEKLAEGKIKFRDHEIVPVWEPPSDETPSY